MPMRSLADGILKGMIQRKQQEQKDQIVQQQMKQVDQQIKLREQQMKMEERADQRAQALEEQKQNLINKINNYLGGELGGGEISAQQGMQGQQGDRLINMLTDPRLLLGGQVAGVNLAPIANTVLGKQRLEEQRRGTDIRQQTFERGASEGSYEDWWNEKEGRMDKVWVSKYGGGLGQRPTLPGKPRESDLPVKEADRPFYLHKDTMRIAPQGADPKELADSGYIRIAPTQMEKVKKVNAVQDIMQTVVQMMQEVIPMEENIGKLGGFGREISAAAQLTKSGQKLAALRDFIDANKAQVAKALGEVGNLSETEQEAVIKGFGSIGDAGPKAWKQFGLLQQTFRKAKSTALGTEDVGDLPEVALGQLREGVITTFANGQTWTLALGTPVRIN